MIRSLLPVLLLASLFASPALAIQTSGGYVTTAPTVANWNSDWPTGGTTGSDYVGQVNGASGVYLGNNWVLTAGHVGEGNFTIGGSGGTTYTATGPAYSISNGNGANADLTLFQISTAPSLGSLTLSYDSLTAFSASDSGSQVVMLGFGGSSSLSWGANTVTDINQDVDLRPPPNNLPFDSNDFFTDYGTVTLGSATITNNSILFVGDSGGGDFVYDPVHHTWVLAGINEVVDTTDTPNFSGFVQLNTYADQIQAITGINVVPEPSTWGLLGLGLLFMCGCSRGRYAGRPCVKKA